MFVRPRTTATRHDAVSRSQASKQSTTEFRPPEPVRTQLEFDTRHPVQSRRRNPPRNRSEEAQVKENRSMAATIMLVDADAVNSSDWKAFLTNQGYRVVGVETGRTAIQRCPELKPDLVLLNSSLPDIPGFQVCKRLKADPMNRLTPVIMVVQESEPFEASRAYQSGADDFWNKPASRWEALNRVETILQLKTYIDQQAEEVLYTLARSIESKTPMMAGHSARLSEYTVEFGEHLGLTTEELGVLRAGSL